MYRIIDNKRVEITDAEIDEYEKICRAHDIPGQKGEELFRDRFAVDDAGRIIYLKALGNRRISFEVLFFLMNLMQNQHLRAMYKEHDAMMLALTKKFEALEARERILDQKIAKL